MYAARFAGLHARSATSATSARRTISPLGRPNLQRCSLGDQSSARPIQLPVDVPGQGVAAGYDSGFVEVRVPLAGQNAAARVVLAKVAGTK